MPCSVRRANEQLQVFGLEDDVVVRVQVTYARDDGGSRREEFSPQGAAFCGSVPLPQHPAKKPDIAIMFDFENGENHNYTCPTDVGTRWTEAPARVGEFE